jgi:hypothetical protein
MKNDKKKSNSNGVLDMKKETKKTVNPNRLTDEMIFQCIIFVMMSGRVPDTFDAFHKFMCTVMVWLNTPDPITSITNGERLGMDPADVSQCIVWLKSWTSGGDPNHPKIYEAQADKKKRNKETTDAYHDFEAKFNKWFHPQLDIMAANPNLTSADMLTLNIKKKPETHHRTNTPITELASVKVSSVAPGVIKLDCKADSEDSRPKLPENADAIEVTYACYGKDDPGDTELNGKWKKNEPQNYLGCTYRESHTRASFEVNIGVLYSGMAIKGWTRYIDIKNPARDGKWSNPFMLIVP